MTSLGWENVWDALGQQCLKPFLEATGIMKHASTNHLENSGVNKDKPHLFLLLLLNSSFFKQRTSPTLILSLTNKVDHPKMNLVMRLSPKWPESPSIQKHFSGLMSQGRHSGKHDSLILFWSLSWGSSVFPGEGLSSGKAVLEGKAKEQGGKNFLAMTQWGGHQEEEKRGGGERQLLLWTSEFPAGAGQPARGTQRECWPWTRQCSHPAEWTRRGPR